MASISLSDLLEEEVAKRKVVEARLATAVKLLNCYAAFDFEGDLPQLVAEFLHTGVLPGGAGV